MGEQIDAKNNNKKFFRGQIIIIKKTKKSLLNKNFTNIKQNQKAFISFSMGQNYVKTIYC